MKPRDASKLAVGDLTDDKDLKREGRIGKGAGTARAASARDSPSELKGD